MQNPICGTYYSIVCQSTGDWEALRIRRKVLISCHYKLGNSVSKAFHYIKIPFINKGMDFIDLPSIFRDKSLQSSIPNNFKNCEVCYKYNKPFRGAIFNFNKLVSDLDIETCTPDS